jgi:sugar phosphate isomerase/epimerase
MEAQPKPRCFGFMASLDFRSWPAEAVANCLAGLGYSAVEWTLAHFHPSRSLPELAELVRITEKHGLVFSEAVIQQDLVSLNPATCEERIELVEASIRAAAQTGVKVLNVFTGPAPWIDQSPRLGVPGGISEGEAWKLVFRAYERLLTLAERQRVYLAVEPCYSHLVHDYYTLKELLDHFDSEYLKVNFDPSHFQLYGNDVPWAVRRLGDRICHVHLKDVVGRPGAFFQDFSNPMLGGGKVDWKAFAAALDDIGYTGALSVEFEAFSYYEKVLKNDPARAAEVSMEQLKNLF